jgi:hypothetical protein
MKLDAGSNLSVMGDVSVAGNLSVTGLQNIFKVVTQPFALSMAGLTTPRFWTYNYGGFSHIYAAYVVLQGFSIWNNDGNTSFTTFGHASDPNTIPQHVYVKVDTISLTQTTGHCFCSESKESFEGDNTVLFTVVVMGRP